MSDLPQTVGPLTLTRTLGSSSVTERFVGQLGDGTDAKPVVAHRLTEKILKDPRQVSEIDARVKDLLGARHPFLVQVRHWLIDGERRYLVNDLIDGVSLAHVIQRCRRQGMDIPHNVYLNFATQICNGLEALHGRTGKGTGAESVLHLALQPGAIFLTRDGKIILGHYGLVRSPAPSRIAYFSPEQTHRDATLTPASDIFSLGCVLYEMLTLQPLFHGSSNLQTIEQIRLAQLGTCLSDVKGRMTGLDRVLQRALAVDPSHRYRRAFLLREDLRGLMANYSFNTIVDDTRSFVAPFLEEEDDDEDDSDLLLPSISAPAASPEAASPEAASPEATSSGDASPQAASPDDVDFPPITEEYPGEKTEGPSLSTAELAARALAHRAALSFVEPPSPFLPGPGGSDLDDPVQLHQRSAPKLAPEDPPIPSMDSPPILIPREADVDPNSTQGFLMGHRPTEAPAPPTTEPRPAPAPTVPEPAPEPKQRHPSPPPQPPTPLPHRDEPDIRSEVINKRTGSGGLAIGLGLAAVFVIVCAGGAVGIRMFSAEPEPDPVVRRADPIEPPVVAEASAEPPPRKERKESCRRPPLLVARPPQVLP
ncbi:MAG: protein kinase, partial [Myxococcota bacterium]